MEKVLEKISKACLYLLVVLLPLFFLPYTQNTLNLNKQALLISLVSVSFVVYVLRFLIFSKTKINLSKINIPILALTLSLTGATVYSSLQHESFWGTPWSVSQSLVTYLFLFLFYFLAVNIFKKKELLLAVVLFCVSSFLALIYGVLQIQGKFILPFDFSESVSFNTIGTPNSLAVLSAVLFPLFLLLIMSLRRKAFFILAFLVSFLFLFLVNFPPASLLALLGFVLAAFFAIKGRKVFDIRWLALPVTFLLVLLIVVNLALEGFSLPAVSQEATLPHDVSFDIALKAIKDSPVFGFGLSTFNLAFLKYKGVEVNLEPFWGSRFERGSSAFINILTEAGILGGLCLLVLAGTVVFYGFFSFLNSSFDKLTLQEIPYIAFVIGCFASLTILIVSIFLYPLNLSLSFLFFLLLAVFTAFWSKDKKEISLNPLSYPALGTALAFIGVCVFCFSVMVLGGAKYRASLSYEKGIEAWQAGEQKEAIRYVERAADYDPKTDLYWQETSRLYLQLIQEYISNPEEIARELNISREELNTKIQLFVDNSIVAAELAIETSPQNGANWLAMGYVCQNLIGIAANAEQRAVDSYREAMNLEPTNPYLPHQIAMVFLKTLGITQEEETRKKLLSEAKYYLTKAIELKEDYAQAHLQLAMAYQLEGNNEKAVASAKKARDSDPENEELSFRLGLIYYQIEDYQKAEEELQKTLSINNNYSNALYFLSLVKDKLGKREEAAENMEKVVALNPDNEQARVILENLVSGRSALEGLLKDK